MDYLDTDKLLQMTCGFVKDERLSERDRVFAAHFLYDLAKNVAELKYPGGDGSFAEKVDMTIYHASRKAK